jgi:DNA replication and repair protein RecF
MNAAASALYVTELSLQTFRSYASLEVQFSPGLNVLWGPNGVGKTNLLEAIAYLALGRSPRTARDADLVMAGQAGFRVDASYAVTTPPAGSRGTLAVSYRPEAGRSVWVDGTQAPSAAALYGRLTAVFFSPDDLWLLKGPPALRRSLLDRVLVQAYPLYADAVLRYRQALAQRNATLREVRARRVGRALLAIWEPQLVQYGAEIMRRRAEALEALAPAAEDAYRALAGGGEGFTLRYVPGLPASHGQDGPWEERLQAALRRSEADDIAVATTTAGPHRDDFDVVVGGRSARRFASQGQQRSAVLALKFAERAYLRRRAGKTPLLLVDDVLSELDPRRRHALQEMLEGEGQVFLTTADDQQAASVRAAAHFAVLPGRVLPCRPPA